MHHGNSLAAGPESSRVQQWAVWDLMWSRSNLRRCRSESKRPGNHPLEIRDAVCDYRSWIETWRWRELSDQWRCDEPAEVWRICVLDSVSRQFEALADQEGWAGREVTHLLAILQGRHPTKCPSLSDIRGYRRGAEGPLRRPHTGGGLVLITHSKDPAERLVVTGIHMGFQAVDPPGPCQTGWGLV